MMSRGMGLPKLSWRKPVSMTWLIKVLISITSPFLALAGTTIRVAGMLASSSAVEASRLGHDDIGPARPETTVAHLGDDGDPLCRSEPYRGLHARHPRSRTEVEAHNIGNGVLLREDVKHLDVVGGTHWARDGDFQRHGVAVLRQFRQLYRHAARLDAGVPSQGLRHRLGHTFRRRLRGTD